MSAWESFGGDDGLIGRVRQLLESGREAELKAQRRKGLVAYERAMRARGPVGRREIRNSFLDALGLDDDDI